MASVGGGVRPLSRLLGRNLAPRHPAWSPVHVPTRPALSLRAGRALRQRAGSVTCPACPPGCDVGPRKAPGMGVWKGLCCFPQSSPQPHWWVVSDPGSQMRVLGPLREEPGRTPPAVLPCLPPPSSSLEA